MAKNDNLHKAKEAKNDEFYTQIGDIEKELKHYKEHFKGKTVFCNCDDPEWSNFWKYFHLNFGLLGLKKLVTTHYDASDPTYKMEYTGGNDSDTSVGVITPLKQNGDFRSPECIELLKDADIVCKAIAEELAALDSKNAETYRTYYTAYSKKLAALDAKYKEAVTKAPVKTVLFGDRFPFRYLTDDYGLQYYAAFNGCSAETEASFATVAFLAKKMDELKLPAVLTIEGRQHKLAQTIVENTKAKNQKVLTLNSMQSVTEEEIKKGITYLAVMEQNLNVFKEALQAK